MNADQMEIYSNTSTVFNYILNTFAVFFNTELHKKSHLKWKQLNNCKNNKNNNNDICQVHYYRKDAITKIAYQLIQSPITHLKQFARKNLQRN